MKKAKYQTYFNDGEWIVQEIKTDMAIAVFGAKNEMLQEDEISAPACKQAHKMTESLNQGSGFNGETPRFFAVNFTR